MQRDVDFRGALVSIHDVAITPDLRHCNVFIGVLGGPHADANALRILEKNRGMLQRKLSKRVVLKNTPKLYFKVDHSVERGVQTLKILQEIEDELHPGGEPSDES